MSAEIVGAAAVGVIVGICVGAALALARRGPRCAVSRAAKRWRRKARIAEARLRDAQATVDEERLVREALGDWCAQLWDMSASDRCITCDHLGICAADMDPTRCYVAECLSDLGVDVERHERSRGFVSQCAEEDA